MNAAALTGMHPHPVMDDMNVAPRVDWYTPQSGDLCDARCRTRVVRLFPTALRLWDH